MIGGENDLRRNVISGNLMNGVQITEGSNATAVEGNYIGTDPGGLSAIPNEQDGVLVDFGANSNYIGVNSLNEGYAAGQLNVISGNGADGVQISGAATNSNVVAGNDIGTVAGGTNSLGNSAIGVEIDSGASSNVVGDGFTSGSFGGCAQIRSRSTVAFPAL